VPPSTQYYGRIFGCFTADRHGLRSLAEVGEDNICFETDYPHSDSTWPKSGEVGQKLMGNLPEDVVRKLVRGNAIEMLGLDFEP
jgi:predicted TIM-barrel fold metal-dependent hydrolase